MDTRALPILVAAVLCAAAAADEPLPAPSAALPDVRPEIRPLPPVEQGFLPRIRLAALGDPQDLSEPLLPDDLAPPGQPRQEFEPPTGRKLPPGAKPGMLQQAIFTATELPKLGADGLGLTVLETSVTLGMPAPTVWETQSVRREGGDGYAVVHPDEDSRKNYAAIYDVSGDGSILNGLISRLSPGGEVVLAGFYKQDLNFAFAPAFMREAQIRVAAQWKQHDLLAVTALVETGALSLDGLITHTCELSRARQAYEVAFGDPQCLKMMVDWRA